MDSPDPLEGAPVGSASKGRLRAEIEGRGEGSFLPPQGETKAVSWGIPLTLEVKFKLKWVFLLKSELQSECRHLSPGHVEMCFVSATLSSSPSSTRPSSTQST